MYTKDADVRVIRDGDKRKGENRGLGLACGERSVAYLMYRLDKGVGLAADTSSGIKNKNTTTT